MLPVASTDSRFITMSQFDWSQVNLTNEQREAIEEMKHDLEQAVLTERDLTLELGKQAGLNAIGKSYKPVNNFLKPKPPKFTCGNPEDAHRFVRDLRDYFALLGLKDTE